MTKLLLFLSLIFPWVVLLIKDNPGGAVVALVLQATIIGWPLASIWAWREVKEASRAKHTKKDKKTQ